jgi:hypothetical protein
VKVEDFGSIVVKVKDFKKNKKTWGKVKGFLSSEKYFGEGERVLDKRQE